MVIASTVRCVAIPIKQRVIARALAPVAIPFVKEK